MHTLRQHLTKSRIFGDGTTAARFAGLRIRIVLCFGHKIKANGKGLTRVLVQRGNEIDAFDISILAMIPVPTHDLVFVRVRFLFNRVIKDQHAGERLHLTHQVFHGIPQVSPPDFFGSDKNRVT